MHRNLKINFFHVHQTNLEQNYFDCLILTEFNRSDRTWIFSWSKMGVTNKFHLCGARFNAYNGRHCLSATVVEWMAMKPERVLSYMSLLPFLSFYSYLPIKKSQIDMNIMVVRFYVNIIYRQQFHKRIRRRLEKHLTS